MQNIVVLLEPEIIGGDLDEMARVREHLRGVCDDGENFHGLATTRAGQEIHLIDLQGGRPGANTRLGRK